MNEKVEKRYRKHEKVREGAAGPSPEKKLKIGYSCSVRIHFADNADLPHSTTVWWHINHIQTERELDLEGRGRRREGVDEVGRQHWKLQRSKVL